MTKSKMEKQSKKPLNTFNIKKIVKVFLLSSMLILSILAVAIWFFAVRPAEEYVFSHESEIQELLNKSVGFPVEYKKLEAEWRGFTFRVRLKDVLVYDKPKPVPFMSAKNLDLHANVLQLILNPNLPFKNIAAEDLKIVLGWDPNDELTILGLKGEHLPSSIDIQSVLAGISTQDSFKLKNAEIKWIKLDWSAKQFLSGIFTWDNFSKTQIHFSGNQSLEFNEKAVLPNSKIDFSHHLEKHKTILQIDYAGSILNFVRVWKKGEDTLECGVDFKNFALAPIHQRVELGSFGPAWLQWLIPTLEEGSISRGDLYIKGPMNHLDWKANLKIKNVDFRYDPLWPKIEGGKGEITVDKEVVTIDLDKGNILGTPIESVHATVGPLQGTAPLHVVVDSVLKGRLETGLKFVNASPLRATVGSRLTPINPFGPMALNLHLDIPIVSNKNKSKNKFPNKPEIIKVAGELKTEGAELMLSALDLPVRSVKGEFKFTEEGIFAKDVTALVYNKLFHIDISSEGILAEGLVTADLLQQLFSFPGVHALEGATPFKIHLAKDESLSFESDLLGLESKLPAPLAKTRDQKQSLILTVMPNEKGEKQFTLNLHSLLQAKWMSRLFAVESSSDLKTSPRADAKSFPVSTVNITGNAPKLDIDAWWKFFEKEKSDISSFALQLRVKVQNLILAGLKLENTELQLMTNKSKLLLGLDGPKILGHLDFSVGSKKALDITLINLNFSKGDIESIHSTELFQAKNLIPISFRCQTLKVDETRFGSITVDLNPNHQGYSIQNFTAQTESYVLKGTGAWQLGEKPNTSLKGSIVSSNIEKTFSEWGFNTGIRDSKGQILFNLRWSESPFQFSLKTASGFAELNFKPGRIVGVNPGLGRIIGLLSLDSISRRLQLDFRDLYKKGFIFDSIEGVVNFQKGFAFTNQFAVNGPSAKIDLSGKLDLNTKGLDMQMNVIPKVGSSAPLVATLATGGNPVVGAGVWLIDKLTGSRISQMGIAQHSYRVTGTIDAPDIQELGVTELRKRGSGL